MQATKRNVVELKVHPAYIPDAPHPNDIALLKVIFSFMRSSSVQLLLKVSIKVKVQRMQLLVAGHHPVRIQWSCRAYMLAKCFATHSRQRECSRYWIRSKQWSFCCAAWWSDENYVSVTNHDVLKPIVDGLLRETVVPIVSQANCRQVEALVKQFSFTI